MVYLPLWKYVSSSVGIIIHNIWKFIKVMFQTTNQISFFTSLGGGKPKKKTTCLQWMFIIEYTHITGHFRIRLIGGTDSIYKAYLWGLNFNIPTIHMAKHMVRLRTSNFGSWNFHWLNGQTYDPGISNNIGDNWTNGCLLVINICLLLLSPIYTHICDVKLPSRWLTLTGWFAQNKVYGLTYVSPILPFIWLLTAWMWQLLP